MKIFPFLSRSSKAFFEFLVIGTFREKLSRDKCKDTVHLGTNLDRTKMEHGWNKFKADIFL